MKMTNSAFTLYDAFKSAGVAEDKARQAADSLAEAVNQAPLRTEISDIKGTLKLHSWMLGFNVAPSLLLLGIALRGTLLP